MENKENQGFHTNIKGALQAGDKELNRTLLNDPFFIRFMKSSPLGMAIFNYELKVYEYFSPNIEDLLGYPADKLQGISGADFATNIYHPDHVNLVIKQMDMVKKFYDMYAVQKRVTDTRYTFTLQLKRANEKFLWTLMQSVVLEVNRKGFPFRSMLTITDITDIKNNSKVDFVFAIKDTKDKTYKTIHCSHHEPTVEYILTEREIDVLNCISKGLRNHEIADKLNISKHTVITHRRNIMKKTGKDNIIQLLVE